MMKTWSLEVQKLEDGDQFIEFPKELMDEVGWEDGDVLEWTPNDELIICGKSVNINDWDIIWVEQALPC